MSSDKLQTIKSTPLFGGLTTEEQQTIGRSMQMERYRKGDLLFRAGETGGFLDLVLGQIAELRSREQDLKGKVKSALVYPAVLSVLASAVLVFLLVYFIPRFSTTALSEKPFMCSES